jgi:vacuolar-type H+-ATPase subunit I/STV1
MFRKNRDRKKRTLKLLEKLVPAVARLEDTTAAIESKLDQVEELRKELKQQKDNNEILVRYIRQLPLSTVAYYKERSEE